MAFVTAVESAQELLTEFLETAKQMLIDDLDNNNRNATGRTKRSIKVINVTPFSGQLVGAEHILYTYQGRGPGKMPPLSNIIDWCAARGIPRSAAWIIAKRISEAGTRLFRQGAMNDNALLRATSKERIETFTSELKKLYTANLTSDFHNLINR